MRPSGTSPLLDILRWIDPAWLFLITGLTLIGATVIIAAQQDLTNAQYQRDRALVIESQHLDRVDRYASFLDALEHRDESVVRSMLAIQLNETTAGRSSVDDLRWSEPRDASIFPMLEPDPIRIRAEPEPPESLLGRLATGERSRLWLLAVAAICVLYGLLPPAVPKP